MSEARELRLGNWIAALGILGGALVGYGFLQSQVSTLEHRADSQSAAISKNADSVVADEKAIDVINTKLDYIQQGINDIRQKLDEKR